MATRTEAKKHEKQARILEAAADLFREHGFEATTTRAIAARAGIANGTLFLYVHDKDEALALVYEGEVRTMLASRISSLPTRAGFRARLRHLFGGFFELYGEQPALARRFVENIPRVDERRRATHDALNARIASAIADEVARGVARGELGRSVQATIATANVFAIARVHLFGWLASPPCDAEQGVAALDAAIAQLVTGLAAKRPR